MITAKDICTIDPMRRPDIWVQEEQPNKESAMDTRVNITAPAPLTEANTEQDKRTYLRDRAWGVYNAKTIAAEKQFGLVDMDCPKTPQEFVDRIKNGLFIFDNPDNASDSDYWQWNNPVSDIRWRDPAVKGDKEGFKAAREVLKAEHIKLKDSIQIKDPVESLAELQAWEAVQ